jgi:hypothetical protein
LHFPWQLEKREADAAGFVDSFRGKVLAKVRDGENNAGESDLAEVPYQPPGLFRTLWPVIACGEQQFTRFDPVDDVWMVHHVNPRDVALEILFACYDFGFT